MTDANLPLPSHDPLMDWFDSYIPCRFSGSGDFTFDDMPAIEATSETAEIVREANAINPHKVWSVVVEKGTTLHYIVAGYQPADAVAFVVTENPWSWDDAAECFPYEFNQDDLLEAA